MSFLWLPTAAATKKDARHAIVPTSPEEWRILYAKWLQQAMLVLGLLPPDAAKVTAKPSRIHSPHPQLLLCTCARSLNVVRAFFQGSNFWSVPAACTRETLEESAELLIRVMKDGDSYYDDEEDMPGSGSQGSDSEQPVSTTLLRLLSSAQLNFFHG